MTIALDHVIRIGNTAVAAIVNRSVRYRSLSGIWFQAAKAPIAVLVQQDNVIALLGLDGSPIDLEDAHERFPASLAAFKRSVSDQG